MATNATQMALHPKLPEPGSRSDKLLSSQVFELLCYWSALGLVIAAGICLIGWKLEHPSTGTGILMRPSDDPFGIATPPWIVELGAPVYVAVVMGHAFWHALHGRRSWRYVVAAATMIAVLAAGKALQAFIK
jgi:hypothetical protein